MNIPIVDGQGQVVGLTYVAPSVRAGRLTYDGAFRIPGCELSSTYIEFSNPAAATKAGPAQSSDHTVISS